MCHGRRVVTSECKPPGGGGAGKRQGFDQFDQEVKTLILVKVRSANIFH